MSLVTLAIPNFNYGRFLHQCLDSAFQQTHGEIEVLVADNCSTDESIEVLQSYRDPRLRWWRNERNLGVYPSWDRLVREARGEYFKILQSDDWLAVDHLETCLRAMQETGCDSAFPGFALRGNRDSIVLPSDHGLRGEVNAPSPEEIGALIWGLTNFVHPTIGLFRRSLVPEGFQGTARHMNRDMVYWAKAIVRGQPVFINRVLAFQRIHPAQDRSRRDTSMAAGDLMDAIAVLRELPPVAQPQLDAMASCYSVTFARSFAANLLKGRPDIALNIGRQLHRHGRFASGFVELLKRLPRLGKLTPADFWTAPAPDSHR